jgi:hypothetical protein
MSEERSRELDRLQPPTEPAARGGRCASGRPRLSADALAALLPTARVRELAGQAHEGMTRAPAQFVDAVSEFLLA